MEEYDPPILDRLFDHLLSCGHCARLEEPPTSTDCQIGLKLWTQFSNRYETDSDIDRIQVTVEEVEPDGQTPRSVV